MHDENKTILDYLWAFSHIKSLFKFYLITS